MKDTRVVKDASGTIDLCETFSTENFKLLQVETGRTYGSSVVDLIKGFDENNKPYSRYTYEETDQKDDQEEEV